jgi:hypothetical protein
MPQHVGGELATETLPPQCVSVFAEPAVDIGDRRRSLRNTCRDRGCSHISRRNDRNSVPPTGLTAFGAKLRWSFDIRIRATDFITVPGRSIFGRVKVYRA